jgi:NADH:ubiquinone oxidoreductase subunit 3 (subunit A)
MHMLSGQMKFGTNEIVIIFILVFVICFLTTFIVFMIIKGRKTTDTKDVHYLSGEDYD